MMQRATVFRRICVLLLLALVSCQRAQEPERLRVVPQSPPTQPRRIAFSPTDGSRLLIVEGNGVLGVWNVSRPEQPTLLSSALAGALDARFGVDGNTIYVTGTDGRLSAWSLFGERLWKSGSGHAGAARAIGLSEDLIVTGGDDGAVMLWRDDGSPAGAALREHKGIVLSTDVSSQGALLSASVDGSIRLWTHASAGTYAATVLFEDPKAAATPWLSTLIGQDPHWGWDHAVAFSPSGNAIVGAGLDGTLRLWDGKGTPHGTPQKAHDGQHMRVVVFAPSGGYFISGGFDGTARIWNVDGTARRGPVAAHQGPLLSVAITPDSEIFATAGSDDRVRLWQADGSKLGELPPGRKDRILVVGFSEKDRLLAVGDAAGMISIYNMDGSLRGATKAHRGSVNAVAFSPQGNTLASVGQDATLKLWNLDGSAQGGPITGHTSEVMSVVFSPRGDLMATGSRMDPVFLRDATGADRGVRFTGLRDAVFGLAFSPAGDRLAAADLDGHFWIWQLDGKPAADELKGHSGTIHEIAFAPDGKQLASAGHDGSVRLWSSDGQMTATLLNENKSAIRSVAFAPDGALLAAGGDDGVLRLWSLPAQSPEVYDLGARIDQVGFFAGTLWARVATNHVLFFDRARVPRVTFVLRSGSLTAFTRDGWFTGAGRTTEDVRIFDADGKMLAPPATLLRKVPERIAAAITEQ